VKRLSSWALPIILGVAGLALIIIGALDLDAEPTASLPPIATATPTQIAEATPTPEPSLSAPPSSSAEPTVPPTPSPLPSSVVAVQLDVPAVGIRVVVRQSASEATDNFPPDDAAYILRSANQPGRNSNSYIFAHALNTLFKPLWNVQVGDEVLVGMSDESILRYVVTEVRPNVACPDPLADPALNPPDPPLALQIQPTCDPARFWLEATDYERLTLQTSQGYNRNWGELVIVAEPVRS
jgi:sortase (surface protein transpeptidase)